MWWRLCDFVEKFVGYFMPASADCFRCGRRLVRGQFMPVKVIHGDTVMLCRQCYEDVYRVTYSKN